MPCSKGHAPQFWRYMRGHSGKGWCLICQSVRHRERYANDPAYRQKQRDKSKRQAQSKQGHLALP
jgi:hypothetical protein